MIRSDKEKLREYLYTPDDDIDTFIRRFLQKLRKHVLEKYGDSLSVMLVGSLARGEATWSEDNGVKTLMSDIDFFIAYHGENPGYTPLCEEFYEIARSMPPAGISASVYIHFTLLPAKKLQRSEHRLVTYDAAKYGKIIAGPDISGHFPDISRASINSSDIRSILFHKSFDIAREYWIKKTNGSGSSPEYRLVKGILELQTVVLYRSGHLESGVINRQQLARGLDSCRENLDLYEYCVRKKLNLADGNAIPIEVLAERFIKICTDEYRLFQSPSGSRASCMLHNFRHFLGYVRRTLEIGRIVLPGKHFQRISDFIQNGGKGDFRTLAENHYILMAYPIEKDRKPL